VSDAGGDAIVDGGCAVSINTGSPTCNQCVQSQCCAAVSSCGTPDDAGVDDAGNTACELLLKCTLDCVAGNSEAGVDGGSTSSCEASCSPTYTQAEQQSASAVLSCRAASCSPQCP
jgi:hypothetical protein